MASSLEDLLSLFPPELRGAVQRLVEWLRTEPRDMADARTAVEELARAQARTEAVLRQLAEAQVRTEGRLTRLEEAIERLVEAQARTEKRVDRLEAAVERLAEAQVRTEDAVRELTRAVGGLAKTIGGDIEDIAYIVVHDVLEREFGWQVGVLERTWQKWNGEPEEVNLLGKAEDPKRPGETIWIVGEAKHNLTRREVERFARQVERARRHLVGEVFPVCFCYRARPEVREEAQRRGLRLVFSYGRLV